ncbi:hypothetical protein BJ508DRAFT_232623 [Ascobolus immersus RN42]|uniref:DNA mismatch repair protein S5 domain-containing protein n=1 Tax=Ascobolus immersus RN42 TaxID=1160509 RepID=A0A3N4IQE0_ASCIM|nr:hypothetical protein BJ508DRAFT_232623 [Ascobolus immersus RN42]
MSIAPLPASSVASLTSSQTLTNPPSLLKELIENSLDAGATSISVEVSPNLLDSIQVRDNGHGISPEGRDRELVAKRHCTSKLRGMMDLALVRSLGFRGEALASAAEMGELKITTRVDGEKTAVILEIDKGGSVVSQKPTSAPQGTTIKVTNFLKGLPVRREVVAKAPQKLYPTIRKLLITYALSRPDVRFSFRIVGGPKKAVGKSEDWVYAPSKIVQEAVTKIVGKEISSNCIWKEFDTSENEDDMHFDPEGMRIDALLITPGTDPKKVGKKGHATAYIFVDSRPVSTARPGIFKSIITLYKSYLKSAHPDNEAYSDPFIYLNLHCPLGFYDPNVEPAKDDVIFTNSTKVLDGVERLFKDVYGDKEEMGKSSTAKSAHAKAGVERQEGFNLLLAKKTPAKQVADVDEASSDTVGPQEQPEEEHSSRQLQGELMRSQGRASPTLTPSQALGTEPSSELQITPYPSSETGGRSLRRRKSTNWGTNMHSGNLSSDEEETLRDEPDSGVRGPVQDEEEEEPERNSTNPWVIAKMNARIPSSNHPSSNIGLRSSSPARRHRDSSPPTSFSRQQRRAPSHVEDSPFPEPLSKRQRLGHGNNDSSPIVQYIGDSTRRMGRVNPRPSQRRRRAADEDDHQEESQTPTSTNNHSLDRWIVSGQSGNTLRQAPQPRTEEEILNPTQQSPSTSTATTPRTRRTLDAPIRLTPTHSTRSTPHHQSSSQTTPQTPTNPTPTRRRRAQDNQFDHLITTPFRSPLQGSSNRSGGPVRSERTNTSGRGPDSAPRPVRIPTANPAITNAGFQTAAAALAQGVGHSSPPQYQDPEDAPQILPEPFINALLFPNRGPKKTSRKYGRGESDRFDGVELELEDLDAEMTTPPRPERRKTGGVPEEQIKSAEFVSTQDAEGDAPVSPLQQRRARKPRRLITPEPQPQPEQEEEVPPAQPPARNKSKKRVLTAEDLLVVGPTRRIQGKNPPEDWIKPLLLKVRGDVDKVGKWAVGLEKEDVGSRVCLWEDGEVKEAIEGWLGRMLGEVEEGWEIVPAFDGGESGPMDEEAMEGVEVE